jgi:hypothetical protein
MATTYEAIATVTVGSGGAASIDFTSIPATYTDLIIKYSARSNRNDVGDDVKLQFNGVTTGYSNRRLYGYSTGVTSDAASGNEGGWATAATATANTFSNDEIYIPNYTSSNQKSFSVDGVAENNSSNSAQVLVASLSTTTSAISSLAIIPVNGSLFVQYSTATLYGIKNS